MRKPIDADALVQAVVDILERGRKEREQERRPIATCSQCGSAIFTADIFKGPVCPRCGHWC